MLKQSQVTVMSMSKWADFIAIDFTPSPFHFRRASNCRFGVLSTTRKPTPEWRTVVRKIFWPGRFSNLCFPIYLEVEQRNRQYVRGGVKIEWRTVDRPKICVDDRVFTLNCFPTVVSTYCLLSNNKIDSPSRGGVNIEWRTVDRPKICVDDRVFTLNCFTTVVSTYCLLVNNKIDSPSRGGSISNDALSTNSWRIITVVSWRIET